MIGRVMRLIIGGFIATTVVAAIAALVAKRQIVSAGTTDSDEIQIAAIFDSARLESTAQSFRGGSILAWFGGVDLDLRNAKLDPGGADLTVRAIFGGGRLIVPADWVVDVRMLAIAGGAGDGRPAVDRRPDAPLIVVEGFALFGGLGIDSVKVESEKRDAPVSATTASDPLDALVSVASNGDR